MGEQKALPYVCPQHPEALVRHEWNRTRSTVRLTGASWESDSDHRYYCHECGVELAPDAPPPPK